jgi:hypothetical protein
MVLFLGARYEFSKYPELLSRPWSAIVTSSRNPTLLDKIQDKNPRIVTDPSMLKEKLCFNHRQVPIIFLNGTEDEDYATEDNYELLLQREENCEQLLGELVLSVKKTLGIIVMEGYTPGSSDEVPINLLNKKFAALHQESLWFLGFSGADDAQRYLEKRGIAKACFNDEAPGWGILFKNFSEEWDAFIDSDDEPETGDFAEIRLDRSFFVGKAIKTLDEYTLNNFKMYGQLLTLRHMDDSRVSYNLQTEWFYTFLKDSVDSPQWFGYSRRWGFNFMRKIDSILFDQVKTDLESNSDQERAIILRGQTCSGKSIALSALAWRIFHELRYPVIYISRKDLTFSKNKDWVSSLGLLVEALDSEDVGAKRVVIIWDASFYSKSDDISGLKTFFENRGKKVYIIASAINRLKSKVEDTIEAGIGQRNRYYTIDISLEPSEKDELKKLLAEKGGIPQDRLDKWLETNMDEDNLLALLYKLVYQMHPSLRTNVEREILACLNYTEDIIKTLPTQEMPLEELTAVGLALKRAYEKVGLQLYDGDDAAHAGREAPEWGKELERFYRALAVGSQFDLNMPTSLAMKMLAITDGRMRDIIFKAPSLKHYEDTENRPGEYSVSFRTPVEAKLYISSLGWKEQFEVVADMIYMLAEDSYQIDIDFVARLLRIMGPNSPHDDIKAKVQNDPECIELIINVLETTRLDSIKRFGHYAFDLLVQEIVFIREYYGPANPKAKDIDNGVRIANLEKAVCLAKDELDEIQNTGRGQQNKNLLTTEYAFCWCALWSVKGTGGTTAFMNELEIIISIVAEGIDANPGNSFGYTAIMRAFNEIPPTLTHEQKKSKYKYLGIIRERLDIVDANFPDISSNDQFITAKNQFKLKFSNDETDEYCDELINGGLPIGLYLKASNLLDKYGIDLRSPFEAAYAEKLHEVISILEDKLYAELSQSHPACQYLLLRLKYLYYNKDPFFSGDERQRTYLNESQWEEILAITMRFSDAMSSSNASVPYYYSIYYIQALALASLGRYPAAEDVFLRIYERDFNSPIRTKTWHLICDSTGEPIKFSGRLNASNQSDKGKGRIMIDGFKKGVYYSHRDVLMIPSGRDTAPNLCVGLSYISFVAYSRSHNLIKQSQRDGAWYG